MTFTMEALSSSIAGHLAPELPGVTFYDNPAQQGVKPRPCSSGGPTPGLQRSWADASSAAWGWIWCASWTSTACPWMTGTPKSPTSWMR